ncbi:probable L-ascorbate peroxidase 4, peroxisomal [Coccomyxa sp. Obi]|nr:probable L-ascorbate peroxidase 4, peroxisomal [Coccomyxa sp. Obi]
MLIRLAFNDALTYDAPTNTSGANGSIRNKKELAHEGNKGLQHAVDLLKPIKEKYPNLSYADFFQLAGMLAVEAAGGPTIPFTPGRKDSWSFPPSGRLPDPTIAENATAHLRAVAERLGLPLRQFVALMGVHKIGRWWRDVQPPYFHQFYAPGPLKFDNSYFKDLVSGKLPKDGYLLGDLEIRQIIETFAEDEAIFTADYVVAHEALSLLGTKLPTAREAASAAAAAAAASEGQALALPAHAQVAVGVAAVVIGAVVVGGWYWRRRRRLQAPGL